LRIFSDLVGTGANLLRRQWFLGRARRNTLACCWRTTWCDIPETFKTYRIGSLHCDKHIAKSIAQDRPRGRPSDAFAWSRNGWAGISEDGQWWETKVGTPQGSVASPLLANIYLHYVFDLWVEAWRKKVAKGEVVCAWACGREPELRVNAPVCILNNGPADLKSGDHPTAIALAANLFSLLNADHPLLAISAKIVEEHRHPAVGEYRDVRRFVHSEVITRPLADDVEPVDESEFECAGGCGVVSAGQLIPRAFPSVEIDIESTVWTPVCPGFVETRWLTEGLGPGITRQDGEDFLPDPVTIGLWTRSRDLHAGDAGPMVRVTRYRSSATDPLRLNVRIHVDTATTVYSDARQDVEISSERHGLSRATRCAWDEHGDVHRNWGIGDNSRLSPSCPCKGSQSEHYSGRYSPNIFWNCHILLLLVACISVREGAREATRLVVGSGAQLRLVGGP
jgi:hypothetical protein